MVTELEYNLENDMGVVQISPQVIEMIAKLTAEEVEGVHSISSNSRDVFVDFLRNKNTKGIRSQVGLKETAIDMNIMVEYGHNFTFVAENLQEKVKNSIESMTDLTVLEVNIHISGIYYHDKKEELKIK